MRIDKRIILFSEKAVARSKKIFGLFFHSKYKRVTQRYFLTPNYEMVSFDQVTTRLPSETTF